MKSPSDQIIKGYEVAKGEYVEVSDEELEFNRAREHQDDRDRRIRAAQTRSMSFTTSVPITSRQTAKSGQDAFVVIRDVIEQMKMVALGRVVLTSREHVIALVPRGKGLMGTLLRYPYEVRDFGRIFRRHSERQAHQGHDGFGPPHRRNEKRAFQARASLEDHTNTRSKALIEKKAKGEKIEIPKERPTGKVINLMDALRRSVQAEKKTAAKAGANIA